MNSGIWIAVLVGVLSSVITGGAGLLGIGLSLKNSDKHRRLEANRTTHDIAVSACERSRVWIERSLFLFTELIAEHGNEGGSEFSLPGPLEIYQERFAAMEEVRSSLYRVAMGNADERVRKSANRLHFELGQLAEPMEMALQVPDEIQHMRTLYDDVVSLHNPLRDLEQFVVKAISA